MRNPLEGFKGGNLTTTTIAIVGLALSGGAATLIQKASASQGCQATEYPLAGSACYLLPEANPSSDVDLWRADRNTGIPGQQTLYDENMVGATARDGRLIVDTRNGGGKAWIFNGGQDCLGAVQPERAKHQYERSASPDMEGRGKTIGHISLARAIQDRLLRRVVGPISPAISRSRVPVQVACPPR